jgi:hypothetical protein
LGYCYCWGIKPELPNKKSWEKWCKRKELDPQSDNFEADIEETIKSMEK